MDLEKEREEAQQRVFDVTVFRFEGAFQYQKVWSEVLMQQVQLSLSRYNKYVDSQEAIKNEEISKYKKEWMAKALDLIPDSLLQNFPSEVRKLFAEVFAGYAKSMRQIIMDYILRSPEERKRLHIVMLPRPIPSATDRQLLRGGFSISKFAGSHRRRVETENELKLRLLNNNIVISALSHWWRDFRSFNLVEFKDLIQFVDTDMGTPGTACYSMDVDSFLTLQESHR